MFMRMRNELVLKVRQDVEGGMAALCVCVCFVLKHLENLMGLAKLDLFHSNFTNSI